MADPWHFTTLLDAADHWQALLAGIAGFSAATLAVVLTLNSERRKADHELATLRRSVGMEVRQCVAVAWGSFRSLAKLAQKEDGPITFRMVENAAHFQNLLILPAVADKIALLGPQATEVLIFLSLFDTVRRKVAGLANYRTPDDISPVIVAAAANALAAALIQGCSVIAALKTDEPTTAERDALLSANITRDTAAWLVVRRQKWPELQ